MSRNLPESYRVVIPKTVDGNGIAEVIFAELANLGHRPEYFPQDSQVPKGADVVFLFGPFGKFLHIPAQFAGLPPQKRPTFVYWNTEGLPDLRIPWRVTGTISNLRSWIERLDLSPNASLRRLAGAPPVAQMKNRLLRFRYVGDYLYAYQQGWVDVFADISAVYAKIWRSQGIPALVAPFGSFPEWYADLDLNRDIDVLWMGKRGSKRRSEALDRLRAELRSYGVDIYMVDNVERPFVHDEDRTHLLNRTKITLNLLRTWYDENSLRISIAAPNRSLVVSEPLLPHVPQYQAGVHYVSAPIEDLAKTIVYYLEHEAERQRIVENAYGLLTTHLTWRSSIQAMMEAAAEARHATHHPAGAARRNQPAPSAAPLER